MMLMAFSFDFSLLFIGKGNYERISERLVGRLYETVDLFLSFIATLFIAWLSSISGLLSSVQIKKTIQRTIVECCVSLIGGDTVSIWRELECRPRGSATLPSVCVHLLLIGRV